MVKNYGVNKLEKLKINRNNKLMSLDVDIFFINDKLKASYIKISVRYLSIFIAGWNFTSGLSRPLMVDVGMFGKILKRVLIKILEDHNMNEGHNELENTNIIKEINQNYYRINDRFCEQTQAQS